MTRTFWAILIVILLVGGAFLSMLSFGGGGVPLSPESLPSTSQGSAPKMLAVPVEGVARAAISDSWGDARGDGTRGHHGTDIMAPGGTRVLAAAPGRIEKMFQSALGGTTLYVRSLDRRWTYYYAHLSGYAPGIREGMAVRTGDVLAYVGDTGDAGAGNFHLHFGLTRTLPRERWWQGQDVNPYPMLAGKAAAR